MNNGLSFALISTPLLENLMTLPIAPVKPSGFFGGTISSADLVLLSPDSVGCAFDSFEVQPLARIRDRTTANRALRDCIFVWNCFFIFLFFRFIVFVLCYQAIGHRGRLMTRSFCLGCEQLYLLDHGRF